MKWNGMERKGMLLSQSQVAITALWLDLEIAAKTKARHNPEPTTILERLQ
jgi:hypothetical protein